MKSERKEKKIKEKTWKNSIKKQKVRVKFKK